MNLSDQARLLADPHPRLVWDRRGWLSLAYARLLRLGTYLAARRQRAREMRELRRFTDRELWDVGLSRSDLRAIEQGKYRRK